MVRILVIDDERDYGEMLARYFEDKGCVVSIALNGREGLRLAELDPPDVVILDQKMDGLSGMDVLKELRRKASDVFVIMVTVDAEDATRQAAEEQGVNGFLRKPFSVAELSDCVISRIAQLRKKAL